MGDRQGLRACARRVATFTSAGPREAVPCLVFLRVRMLSSSPGACSAGHFFLWLRFALLGEGRSLTLGSGDAAPTSSDTSLGFTVPVDAWFLTVRTRDNRREHSPWNPSI